MTYCPDRSAFIPLRFFGDYTLQLESAYAIRLSDGGCYSLGWFDRLPSGQGYWVHIDVIYAGVH